MGNGCVESGEFRILFLLSVVGGRCLRARDTVATVQQGNMECERVRVRYTITTAVVGMMFCLRCLCRSFGLFSLFGSATIAVMYVA